MGYDTARFQGDVDEELLCPVCLGVLEDPMHVPQCKHAFCKSCIIEWLMRQNLCPVDGQPITPNELKPVPYIVWNLLSCLLIRCDNATFGCTVMVKLEHLKDHHEECEHNPKRLVPCEQGCGLVIPRDELRDHHCVRDVRVMLKSHEHQINEMEHAINEIKRDISILKADVQDCIRLVNPRVPAVAESLDEVKTINYKCTLL